MSNVWNVKVDEKPFNIEIKGSNVIVNGEKTKLRKLAKKTHLMTTDYIVPVGSKTATLIIGTFNSRHLIIDGKDCATGEDYVPQKLPVWAYIFIVLNCINFINGALGALIALVACTATAAVSNNPKLNTFVKVLLDIVIFVISMLVVYGIAYAIYSI